MSERCQKCEELYSTIWKAPDSVWFSITGRKKSGLRCPKCFDEVARKLGIELYWSCQINRYPKIEIR